MWSSPLQKLADAERNDGKHAITPRSEHQENAEPDGGDNRAVIQPTDPPDKP